MPVNRAGKILRALAWLAAAAPADYYAAIFRRLPAYIPVHYSAAGAADRFAPKFGPEALLICTFGLFGALFMTLLSLALTRRLHNGRQAAGVMSVSTLGVSLLFSVLSFYFLTAALG